MSPSDEQKKAAFKAMEDHFGKDAPAFIERFMKAGAMRASMAMICTIA